ncbi:MAG TPA: GTPase ObgE [Candidatus Saccharimonadales bacterium]|nr:GTPase ObgE [Candidatus Saccharimonadales bacterium]
MKFIDKVTVSITAGDGGDGHKSFRHEKFVDHGGPDGGDGGDGGNVIMRADRNENTLAEFRYHKELLAESGQPGSKRRKHGKSAADLIVPVPVGTSIVDENGKTLADLTEDGMEEVIARGGKGGFGNAHFVSSIRQAPNFAEKGEPGESITAEFELKMIADVGLVGLPNAGKSSLLGRISNARPEIADYPFTTLTPNLGVVDIEKHSSLLFADIPGLIEGAALGKGLGHEFLRHIERTKVLIHVIDAYQDDLEAAYKTIQDELKTYKVNLSKRPQLIALNKVEGLDDEIVADLMARLHKAAPKNTPLFAISATSGQGVQELLFAVKKAVDTQKKVAEEKLKSKDALPILTLDETEQAWKVTKDGDSFVVTGKKIEKFAARTDFSNEQAVHRLRVILKKMGISHELERKGIKPDNKVQIGKNETKFEY